MNILNINIYSGIKIGKHVGDLNAIFTMKSELINTLVCT